METERLAGFLHRAIELHVVVVMHWLVTHRRDHEPDDIRVIAQFLDRLERRMRIVERDKEHRLHLRVHRQNVLAEPLVIGAAQHCLHVELRMYAEIQHRRRDNQHVIEMKGFNRAADKRDLAVHGRVFNDLAQLRLMRHPAADILIAQRKVAVQTLGRTAGPVLQWSSAIVR